MNEVDMSTVQRVFSHASDAIVNASKLAQEVAALKDTVARLQEQFDSVVAEKNAQITVLSADLDRTTSELETAKVVIIGKDEANDRLSRTVQGLTDLTEERFRIIGELRGEVATLRREKEENEQHDRVMRERVVALEWEIEALKNERAADKDRILELEVNERALIAENEELIAVQEKVRALISPFFSKHTGDFQEPVTAILSEPVQQEGAVTQRDFGPLARSEDGRFTKPTSEVDTPPSGKGDEFLNY